MPLLSATVEERNTVNAHDKIVSSYARAWTDPKHWMSWFSS